MTQTHAVMNLPIPTIMQSERLTYRIPDEGDGAVLNASLNSTIETVGVYMLWLQEPHTIEQDEAWCRQARADFITRTSISYHLRRRGDDRIIGTVGLHRGDWRIPWLEVGYWLHKDAEKQGYMHEAVNRLRQMCLDVVGIQRLEIRCDPRNTASASVARKAGFTLVGTLRRAAMHVDGTPSDSHIFEWLTP